MQASNAIYNVQRIEHHFSFMSADIIAYADFKCNSITTHGTIYHARQKCIEIIMRLFGKTDNKTWQRRVLLWIEMRIIMDEKLILKNNLKSMRNEKKLSQQQLADMVGVSRNTISSIETGQFNPTAKLALVLCIALECKFEDLFYF
jgi:putative transcriptional regulator